MAFSIAAGAIDFVACAVFFFGMTSYNSRFAPRVRRVREELRDESIRELRREVAELRRQLIDHESRSGKADRRGPDQSNP